uniref:Sialic acid synthase n=2 Tax=Cacopsylla melanoneura TaxID=428564 RepID=A0A8D9AMN6_9HEMI
MRFQNGTNVDEGQPCFIIAEIGQNHQGDLDVAKTMIAKAKECGADCVKFQKTHLPSKFNRAALDKVYDSPHSWGITYGEHKQYLEFSQEEYQILQQYAEQQVGIMFTASAMDQVSFDFLRSLNPPFIKLGSGDSNNIPLIRHAASTMIPLIISTGMLPDISHIDRIYATVSQFHSNFALLHCVSAYPTPYNEVNLRVIATLRHRYPDIPIGYSGHENGVEVCIGAVAMGAQIIEKHFTLNKSLKGNDHSSSLTPSELQALVNGIRIIETSRGSPTKRRQPSETPCYLKLGKTIVTARQIKKGAVIEESDLGVKVAEPRGICGSQVESLVGRRSKRNLEPDESIREGYLEDE